MHPLSKDILTFWFGTTDLSVEIEKKPVWFKSTPEFDRHLIDHYTHIHEQAAAGALDRLQETPEDCLTLILALDQFPRNIYRGTARAFATDAKALEIAIHAVSQGFDASFARWPRTFTYLPFEHSEDLEMQEKGLEHFASIGIEEAMTSAIGHYETIKQFGRFPHRNEVLGRTNTSEEEDYLKDPPLWGKTAAEAEALEKRKKQAEKNG